MTMTPTRQQNAVSEGIALGLLMCDRNSVPHDKVGLDLAFVGAWRGWSHTSTFPQVDSSLRKHRDGTRVMTRATEGKQVWNLFWDTSGADLEIYARSQWAGEQFDSDAIAQSIDGDVPAAAWRALAASFLVRLEPDARENSR